MDLEIYTKLDKEKTLLVHNYNSIKITSIRSYINRQISLRWHTTSWKSLNRITLG